MSGAGGDSVDSDAGSGTTGSHPQRRAGGPVDHGNRLALIRRDGRHGLRIAHAEFARAVRGIAGNPRRLLGVGILLLLVGGGTLASLPVAYLAGRTTRSIAGIPSFGLVATAVPVALFLVAAFRTFERTGRIDAEPLVLLTVHPRAVVLGLIGAEAARLTAWLGLPVAAVVVAFAAGLGAPTVVLTMGIVLLPMAICTTVWGYAAGIAVLRLLRSLPGVSRALKAAGYLAAVAVIVASQALGRYVVESGLSLGWLRDLGVLRPIASYVALGFAGTPLGRSGPSGGVSGFGEPSTLAALAALAAFVVLTPVGLAVATRQATAYWHTDGPGRRESGLAAGSDGRTGFSPPVPFAWRLSGRVAWSHLVRARRSPQDLAHVIPLAFFVAPIGTMLMQTPTGRGPILAGSGVLVGGWLAGAVFCLNPLGDDRPQQPLLLLTVAPPHVFVAGRLVAGLAVGVPVGVLVALSTVAIGTPPVVAGSFAVASVGSCVAAGGLALGLGAALPVYQEREFWGTETVVPSTIALMTYAFVVGGGTTLGLVVLWYGSTGLLPLSPAVAVGVGLYVSLTGGVPYGAYRYARRRVRRYHLD